MKIFKYCTPLCVRHDVLMTLADVTNWPDNSVTLALCIRPTSSCREGRTRRFCTVYLSICHLLPSYRARATRGRHQRIPRRVSATYGVKLWCLVCDHSKTKIFGCCWRESVSCSLYYCKTLPMSYIVDQRIILFWKRALNSDNIWLLLL